MATVQTPQGTALAKALNVSLVPLTAEGNTGSKVPLYLTAYAAELEQEDKPLLLSIEDIDAILWAAIHQKFHTQKLAYFYFYRSWKHSEDMLRSLSKSSSDNAKPSLVLCVNFNPFN